MLTWTTFLLSRTRGSVTLEHVIAHEFLLGSNYFMHVSLSMKQHEGHTVRLPNGLEPGQDQRSVYLTHLCKLTTILTKLIFDLKTKSDS